MEKPRLGRMNKLVAVAYHDSGMMLSAGEWGEILLPHRYVPENFEPGEEIEVFISNDSEDRLVATTERPLAMAGEFALLRVVETTKVGAFLDWGLPKDLLLPFKEQVNRVRTGDQELVHIYVDKATNRLAASARLGKFVAGQAPGFLQPGTPVSLIIAERTELGYRTIVDERYWGLIHSTGSDLKLKRGQRHEGWVARTPGDGLLDITLEPPGYQRVEDASTLLAATLSRAEHGFLPLHDKSSPEEIREALGMSKKVFKQALGSLYRQRKVRLTREGIYWISQALP